MDRLKTRIYRLLRWSEKYTKTDMVYLMSGGFWIVFTQIVSAFSALLLAIFFARILSPTDYGLYKYTLSVGGLVAAFSLSGMGTAIIQAVARKLEGTLTQGFRASLIWGLGMTAITWSMGIYYFVQENVFLALAMFVVGLFQPILNSANLYNAYLVGKRDFKSYALYSAINTSLTTAILVGTLLFTTDPLYLIIVYFISHTTVAIALYFYTHKIHKPTRKNNPETIPYAKHLSVMNIVGSVAMHIDKIIVFQFIGAAELAIYAFAIALPEQVWGVLKGLGNLMIPKFTAYPDTTSLKNALQWKMIILGISLVIVSLLYIIFAPLLFTLFFPTYMEAVPYSQFFAISILALVSIIPTSMLTAQKNEKALYIVNISTSGIQIALIIPMTIMFGLWGVIITRVFTRYAQLVIATLVVMSEKK